MSSGGPRIGDPRATIEIFGTNSEPVPAGRQGPSPSAHRPSPEPANQSAGIYADRETRARTELWSQPPSAAHNTVSVKAL
jgi:hypothetical protein